MKKFYRDFNSLLILFHHPALSKLNMHHLLFLARKKLRLSTKEPSGSSSDLVIGKCQMWKSVPPTYAGLPFNLVSTNPEKRKEGPKKSKWKFAFGQETTKNN